MPTPQSTFFRPDSLSKGGTCKINLRGSSFYDYANDSVVWTPNGTITHSAIVESTPWKLFIPKQFVFYISGSLTRDTLVSTAVTNFTIMFRFYVTSLSAPGVSGTFIFLNGSAVGMAYWGVYVYGADQNTLQFQFLYSLRGSPMTEIIAPSDYIQANRWYHVAVTLQDNERGDDTHTYYGYLDGLRTSVNTSVQTIDTPSGSTTLGDAGGGQSQDFQMTEFVFLEKVLTSDEIKAYATSAYI